MDRKSRISGIAEAKATTELLRRDFDVFSQFTGKAPFDLVAHKDGELFRVEVKSSSTRTPQDTGWNVQVKKVRSNKTVNKISSYDSAACDILVFYLEPVDRMIFMWGKDLKQKSVAVVSDKDLKEKSDWRL
jgi:Holliday junction resolvase-like predicted endonuclease